MLLLVSLFYTKTNKFHILLNNLKKDKTVTDNRDQPEQKQNNSSQGQSKFQMIHNQYRPKTPNKQTEEIVDTQTQTLPKDTEISPKMYKKRKTKQPDENLIIIKTDSGQRNIYKDGTNTEFDYATLKQELEETQAKSFPMEDKTFYRKTICTNESYYDVYMERECGMHNLKNASSKSSVKNHLELKNFAFSVPNNNYNNFNNVLVSFVRCETFCELYNYCSQENRNLECLFKTFLDVIKACWENKLDQMQKAFLKIHILLDRFGLSENDMTIYKSLELVNKTCNTFSSRSLTGQQEGLFLSTIACDPFDGYIVTKNSENIYFFDLNLKNYFGVECKIDAILKKNLQERFGEITSFNYPKTLVLRNDESEIEIPGVLNISFTKKKFSYKLRSYIVKDTANQMRTKCFYMHNRLSEKRMVKLRVGDEPSENVTINSSIKVKNVVAVFFVISQ